MQQWRDRAGWGFLFFVGLVFIIVGFQGRFGSLLAVFLAPDQMLTNDSAAPDKGTPPPPDQSSSAA